jgi:hypothetical protein
MIYETSNETMEKRKRGSEAMFGLDKPLCSIAQTLSNASLHCEFLEWRELRKLFLYFFDHRVEHITGVVSPRIHWGQDN